MEVSICFLVGGHFWVFNGLVYIKVWVSHVNLSTFSLIYFKNPSLSCDDNDDDVDDYDDDCLLRVMADRFGLWPFTPTIKVALLSYRIVNVVVVWNSQASLKSNKLW